MFNVGDKVVDENGEIGTVELIHPTAKRPVLVYIQALEKWRAFFPDGRRETSDTTPRITIWVTANPLTFNGTVAAPSSAPIPKRQGFTVPAPRIDKDMEQWERAFGMSVSDLNKPKCTCDIRDLMISGCKCGHLQRRT